MWLISSQNKKEERKKYLTLKQGSVSMRLYYWSNLRKTPNFTEYFFPKCILHFTEGEHPTEQPGPARCRSVGFETRYGLIWVTKVIIVRSQIGIGPDRVAQLDAL